MPGMAMGHEAHEMTGFFGPYPMSREGSGTSWQPDSSPMEGIHWMRNLLKGLAAEGRTVFVSSHLMSEMSLTADHLIIIGRGRVIADMSVHDFVRQASQNVVRVRSPQADRLSELVRGPGVTVTAQEPGVIEVAGLTSEQVGEQAAQHGVVLHELTPVHASLEEAFMELTREEVEFKAGAAAGTEEEAA